MATDAERVRDLLGETIPVGGSESDTMFTDAKILDLLSGVDSVEAAVAEGWRIKAAQFADLVDTAEGTSKRSMSDLHAHALRMASSFSETIGGSRSRTRLHKLTRD